MSAKSADENSTSESASNRWAKTHPEHARMARETYKQRHPARYRRIRRECYQRNIEKYRANARRYYYKHRDKVLARRRMKKIIAQGTQKLIAQEGMVNLLMEIKEVSPSL